MYLLKSGIFVVRLSSMLLKGLAYDARASALPRRCAAIEVACRVGNRLRAHTRSKLVAVVGS